MSQNLAPGSAGGGAVAHPLLVECDMRGQVLWMSERTRAALGETGTLVETIRRAARLFAAEAIPPVLSVWHVLDTSNGLLIAAQPGPGGAQREEATGWLALQSDLLRHYFRLLSAERRLAVRTRRRGGGTIAIRQVERERARIGRELHTGVGQMLAAIRLQLEIVVGQLPAPPEPVRQALDRISTLAGEALDQVRSTSRRLHPPEWQRLTIEAALQQLWEISGIPQRFAASLRIEPLPREPDPDIKTLLYRSAQEALSNLIRHSRARRVQGTLAVRGDTAVLTIEDDGIGFDAAGLFAAPASVASGIGLRSIREQAESAGGSLTVESGPAGTRFEVAAPFSAKGV